MYWASIFGSLVLATLAQAVVGPARVTGNTAVHDPTICKDKNGKYFVFCKSLRLILLGGYVNEKYYKPPLLESKSVHPQTA